MAREGDASESWHDMHQGDYLRHDMPTMLGRPSEWAMARTAPPWLFGRKKKKRTNKNTSDHCIIHVGSAFCPMSAVCLYIYVSFCGEKHYYLRRKKKRAKAHTPKQGGHCHLT